MSTSKAILVRCFIASTLFQAILLVAISLPEIEAYRQQFAQRIQMPIQYLWIPPLALSVLIQLIIALRLRSKLVRPTEELVAQTRLGATSIAFKKKSSNAEEDHLKHFIESQSLRSEELEIEVARMAEEVERTNELASTPPEEIEALKDQASAARENEERHKRQLHDFEREKASLQSEIKRLQKELKHSYRDLETLQEDLHRQNEDGSKASLSSILAERLRDPLNLINNLSWRLAKSWSDTPPSQVKAGLDEICRQSEEQLELLKKYQSEEDQPERRSL